MPSQITVTLDLGPDIANTAKVYSNVVDVDFQLDRKVLAIRQSDPNKITEFDFANAATVTYTISGGNSTIVVSS